LWGEWKNILGLYCLYMILKGKENKNIRVIKVSCCKPNNKLLLDVKKKKKIKLYEFFNCRMCLSVFIKNYMNFLIVECVYPSL